MFFSLMLIFFFTMPRVSNISEHADDDDGFATDEWDSSDSSDEGAKQQPQQQQQTNHSQNEKLTVRTKYR